MVAQEDGKFDPWGWPQDPSKPKKKELTQTRKIRISHARRLLIDDPEIGNKSLVGIALNSSP